MKTTYSVISDYAASNDYDLDLIAVKELWGRPKALGIAGMFIFLSYATIPDLVKVQPSAGRSRVPTMQLGLQSEHEKLFLLGVLGLREDNGWRGGLRNQKVQESVRLLGSRHFSYVGMQQSYMDFFTGIIALSILKAHDAYKWPVSAQDKKRYWQYMAHVSLLLSVELGTHLDVDQSCSEFSEAYSYPSSEGRQLVEALRNFYPDYVTLCMPVLFPACKEVLRQLLM